MQLVSVAPQPLFELIALSDLHVGAQEAQLEALRAVIASVQAHPHRHVVLLGDLSNAAITNSKSNIYEERLTPQQELDLLRTLFTPIKQQILGLIPGNHEDRIWRTAGIDVTKILGELLNVPYSPTSMIWSIPVGTQTYTVLGHHGSGGGRTTGKFEGNHRLSLLADADVYLSGHIHSGHVAREAHFHTEGGSLTVHEQLFVTTTSWLGYEPYAEKMGFKPGVVRPAVLTFHPDQHDITVQF